MSVDFLISMQNGGWIAIDFKEKKDAQKGRTKEKLLVSEKALTAVGVPHYVLSEDDIPETMIRNIRWLRIHALPFDPPPLMESQIEEVAGHLQRLLCDGRTRVFDAAVLFSAKCGIDPAKLSRACFWLIANRRWKVNLHEPVGPDRTIQFINSS